jgi:nitrogen fixation/metabolism regulation signal transduction histidine kinase
MKLIHFFIIFAVLIGTSLGVTIIATKGEPTALLYVAEALCATALLFLIYFYRKVMRPIKSISSGMELLMEQDLTTRLTTVGQKETDRIVRVFNRLLDKLKDEHLRLCEQNNFLDLLIDASPMGVIILGLNDKVDSCNNAALKFLGINAIGEIKGKRIDEIETPLTREISNMDDESTRTFRMGGSAIYRCSRLSFLDRGFHHPFILIESLTEEVLEAEKKAYGKVIRMMAHEVNNNVAGITSLLEGIEGLPDELVQVCSDRCFAMSRFITRFADVVKIPDPLLADIPINDIVDNCHVFLETLCVKHGARLCLNLCEKNPSVKADSILLEQVLVNLVKNSAESIGMRPENSPQGLVEISTHDDGSLIVADNGIGISEEVAHNLFTPFYSSKPNGQGIGMMIAREILSKHQCAFSLRTDNDGLTRFRITFVRNSFKETTE